MNPGDSKSALRQQIQSRLNEMTPEHRAAESRRAGRLLEQQALWKQAQGILFYAPLSGELDVWPLLTDSLASGKRIALPRFDSKTNQYLSCTIQDLARDIQPGRFGIREPGEHCAIVSSRKFDLILVPGVAFDARGRRLGRGKGFYDQLLSSISGIKCGVAFDEQMVAEVPSESHDIRMDRLLTPMQWIELAS